MIAMPRLTAFLVMIISAVSQADGQSLAQQLRRPAALVTSADGRWLYVANRDSGTISIIDASARSVVNEVSIEGRLADLELLDDQHLLALDQQNHQLLLLSGGGVDWQVLSRVQLAEYPVRLALDRDAKKCYIASLWSRAVTLVEIADGGDANTQLRVVKQLPLSFEPLELCLVRGEGLVVAASFKNVLAAIDNDLQLIAEKRVHGHNIRGLAISPDGRRLMITLQELNAIGQATLDDVHWGNVISNLLVAFQLEEVFDPSVDIYQRGARTLLVEPGNAAGDPGPIHIAATGELALLLQGVNEVGLSKTANADRMQRVRVENRPAAITATADGLWWVANMFSDSVSVIDPRAGRQIDSISLGPQPALSDVQIGEALFFDSRLALDGWMSCHSCHTDGHSNGLLNDNFSDGSFGAPKRVLSLLGTADTGPWAWNGHVRTLEEQVRNSIQITMQGKSPSEQQVAALVAYIKTLEPPPLLRSHTDGQHSKSIARGGELFRALSCQQCHTPPTYTSPSVYDVELGDSFGTDSFNPPSLRGVARRDTFFHDGRAKDLRDVIAVHKHQLHREISPAEVDELLQYLMSL